MKPDWNACKRDCLHCPYPEFPPECEELELDAGEYAKAREIEAYIRPKTRKEQAIAAKKREYREANRDAIAAYQREYREANRDAIAAKKREYYEANRDAIAAKKREYREANRDAIAAKKREYYEANRDAIAAKKREYYEANRDAIAAKQRERIRTARRIRGLTQVAAARLLGVSQPTISLWETGAVPADWDLLAEKFPELGEEERPWRIEKSTATKPAQTVGSLGT